MLTVTRWLDAGMVDGHGSSIPESVDELTERFGGTVGHEPVASEVESVNQSHGTPINAATNRGLRSALG